MSDHAAIAAQVVDIQNDRMHKGFIKVTIHVPAECGQQLTAAMGWPTYTTPVPVAIARLNPDAPPPTDPKYDTNHTSPASGPDIQARARKPVDASKRLAQKAGILCGDPLFQKFLQTRLSPGSIIPYRADEDIRRPEILAAATVRFLCKVESRAELIPNTEAGLRWSLLESAFVGWRDVPEFADAS